MAFKTGTLEGDGVKEEERLERVQPFVEDSSLEGVLFCRFHLLRSVDCIHASTPVSLNG